MTTSNVKPLIDSLRGRFLEKSNLVSGEVKDITDKARIKLCLKEFNESVLEKLTVSLTSRQSFPEDIEPVDRDLAGRITSLSEKVVELGKRLEEKRLNAPKEILSALEKKWESKRKSKLTGNRHVLQKVEGNVPKVDVVNQENLKQTLGSLTQISKTLPNLLKDIEFLIDGSGKTISAVEKAIRNEKTDLDKIIETKEQSNDQDSLESKPSYSDQDKRSKDDGDEDKKIEVSNSVRFVHGVTTALDRRFKRKFASITDSQAANNELSDIPNTFKAKSPISENANKKSKVETSIPDDKNEQALPEAVSRNNITKTPTQKPSTSNSSVTKCLRV